MTISVNYNPSVLKVQRNLSNATNALNKALERMSTGFKINCAADDAAGLYVATGLTTQIRGLTQAKKNTNDGVSFLNTASGSLANMQTILNRLRDLSVQGANGVYDSSARQAMQKESDELTAQLYQIKNGTQFNGIKIFGNAETPQTVTNSVTRTARAAAVTDTVPAGYTAIYTADDLNNIRNDLSGKYILMNDIDLSAISNWQSIGTWGTEFKGVLDGNNHVIKNLTINDSSKGFNGLFGALKDAQVKNLGIEDANITAESTVGILAGQNYGTSTISNCYTTGSIKGINRVGGLVGENNGASITECYTEATVNGNIFVGGLVGANRGKITNVYSIGSVTGNDYTGGFIGQQLSGQVTNCYSTGPVISSGSESGGFTGQGNSNVSECYWDKEKSGKTNSGGGTGKTTAEMANDSTYASWSTVQWDKTTLPPTLKNMPSPTPPPPSDSNIRLQVGANGDEYSSITFNSTFELGNFKADFTDTETCRDSLDAIDGLLEKINTKNSEFGALLNRLDSVLQSQTTQIENLTAARSTIMDADIAEESAIYVKNQILQQSCTALLSQSQNLHKSIILGLLQ